MRNYLAEVVATVLCVLWSHALWGQVERASIVGTIRDNTGSIVPGVVVKITNQATNTSSVLQTDTAGDYSATNLTPGLYTIEAEKSGFARRVYRDFTAEKKFLFTEARQLWFRAEFFDAPNHPEFAMPAATIGANGVGTIAATALPSRQIQFALKFVF